MKFSTTIKAIVLGISFAAGTASHALAMNESLTPVNYDLRNRQAYADIVIPAVIPAILTTVSPTGGDATLVLRITAILTNAWFDAIAPYQSSAVGVYSNLGRRPSSESTDNYYMNIASLYASYRVLNNLLPSHAADWRKMLTDAGLDPDDNQENNTSAAGIGNLAGKAVVKARQNDGMNQLGNEGGRKFNLTPYADYLGYRPVNTPETLFNPSRWQPDIKQVGIGIYRAQQFVTPQMRVTKPYSYANPKQFKAPRPIDSDVRNWGGYTAQAEKVLAESASLTDEHKAIAELFDNKLASLGQSGLFATQQLGLGLIKSIHYEFLTNMAEFDTAIAVWDNKYRYDAVRPFSAIRFVYGDSEVMAWGGPGKGTVYNMPAKQWKPYLGTADHPEYPSGSASFCGAHAEIGRMFFNSDNLNWSVPVSKGSSRVEPGVTPATDIVLNFATWTDFETKCGLSRIWGGVHFPAAVKAGHDIGHDIAHHAYAFVQSHINGGITVKDGSL